MLTVVFPVQRYGIFLLFPREDLFISLGQLVFSMEKISRSPNYEKKKRDFQSATSDLRESYEVVEKEYNETFPKN